MNILIINESSGKAWIRSRRVLSKYLPQLGSRVWAGHVTEEGLGDLKADLKKSKISKTSAIACHLVISRSRMELLWVLGAKHLFDESGRYAFRTTQTKTMHDAHIFNHSSIQKWFLAILRLAALTHDLGKASYAFQQKLVRGKGSEEMRHELVSFFILAHSAGSSPEDLLLLTDAQWLDKIAVAPRTICDVVTNNTLLPQASEWLNSTPFSNGANENCVLFTQEFITKLFHKAPTLGMVLWLVVTHHKLIEGLNDQSPQSGSTSAHAHLSKDFAAASWRTCLAYDNKKKAPWDNPEWLAAIKLAAEQAQGALKYIDSGIIGDMTPSLCAHLLRPLLILSDHLGSSMAQETVLKSDATHAPRLFANTCSDTMMGDDLTTHLMKVSRWSRKFWNFSQIPKNQTPHADVPQSIKTTTSVARFQWQDTLRDTCEKNQNIPAFVTILAETGAGKTLASAKALSGLQGDTIRATWALGLRSLTFQTGKEIIANAGFNKNNVLVAVGHPHSQRLSENSSLKLPINIQTDGSVVALDAPLPNPKYGSESSSYLDDLLVDPDFALEPEHASMYLDLIGGAQEREALGLHWSDSTLKLLSAPLLICTADHLVYSAAPNRGSDAKLYLRHIHADLVLDEIDAYSPSDLQALGKIVFCAGLHHRNVVLMSATATPHIIEGLYAVWRKGVLAGNMVHERNHKTRLVLASNVVEPVEFIDIGPLSAVSVINRFSEQIITVLNSRKTLGHGSRCLDTLDISGSMDNVYDTIIEKARTLHALHRHSNSDCPPLSTGFVEFNTAKAAVRFAEHVAQKISISEDDVQPVIKLITYHAKYPRNYLAVLDATLSQLCTRKNSDQHLKTPVVQKLFSNADVKKRGVLVLVCTTTLIETGRDFDFDFAILEPRSVRGTIQAAGRVCRHRPDKKVGSPNLILLSTPLRALDVNNTQKSYWSRPGVEDLLPNCILTENQKDNIALKGYLAEAKLGIPSNVVASTLRGPPIKPKKVTTTSDALPIRVWSSAMDARLCLKTEISYSDNRIGFIEQAAQYFHLLHHPRSFNDNTIASLRSYFEEFYPLTGWHNKSYPFRGTFTPQVSFVPSHNTSSLHIKKSEHLYFNEKERKYYPASYIETINLSAKAQKMFLLASIEHDALTLLNKAFNSTWQGRDPAIIGVSLRTPNFEGHTKKARWHPLLGFIEE